MRFFSKLTVICNICFLAAVVFWYLEFHGGHRGSGGRIIPLPAIEGTLVIIGYLAIIVNLFFLLVAFIFTAFQVKSKIPTWIIVFNLLMFICQVWFHFFLK
jgi:hypothetical protein